MLYPLAGPDDLNISATETPEVVDCQLTKVLPTFISKAEAAVPELRWNALA